jgi:hypothetical protein
MHQQQGDPIPDDDDCILRLVCHAQKGSFLEYCLAKDGTQRQLEKRMEGDRVKYELATTTIDLSEFWPRWNPVIQKIIDDSKNGIAGFKTQIKHTGVPSYAWFVRNHLGETATIRSRGPIQGNIPFTFNRTNPATQAPPGGGRRNFSVAAGAEEEEKSSGSTLPEYYVELWEMMLTHNALPPLPSQIERPPKDKGGCTTS